MFYDTKLNNHNLKYNPFKACVVPRPIGWISSKSVNGIVNLAPYSYFNAVADIPPVIMFASGFNPDGTKKDSIKNIEETGEFVVNIASFDQKDQVSLSSSALPYEVSEAEVFNIEMENSNFVAPPRVKASKISLECKYIKTVPIMVEERLASSELVLGHVIGVYIDDEIIVDGKIDMNKLKPISRLGYDEYALIEKIFKISRPIA
jgi:flavin reductase (DIM6/NTAB) family NADH-FMN oxidoreductase RutF